jgi:hypothetical protein
LHVKRTMLICNAMNGVRNYQDRLAVRIVPSGPAVKLHSGTFDGPHRFIADLVGARLRDRFTDHKMFVTGWQNGTYVILTANGIVRYRPWLVERMCYLDTELDSEIASPLN